jgi:hypothetical protein
MKVNVLKDESGIVDWRSTGRRKARKSLFLAYVQFECIDCGKTNIEPPKDAPKWFEEIWPETNRVLRNDKNSAYGLQADHLSKDYANNEVENVVWRCPSDHKRADARTGKGVAQKTVKYF